MKKIRFVAQPFGDGRDLRDFIHEVAEEPLLTRLDVVVAWAKRSGLSRLKRDLETIGTRGAETRIIVGIDEGGATRQGLELARALFGTVHVFHDRSGRTFHPKVYLARGDTSARLMVGSHNLTAGGVYFNYEAGLEAELELPDDAGLLASVQEYIDRLHADTQLCLELTDDVMTELLTNPRYRIQNEDARGRPAAENKPEELDSDVDVDDEEAAGAPSIFGASAESKRPDPGTGSLIKKAVAKKAGGAPPAPQVPQHPMHGVVVKRWFKALSASDAQHPPKAGSNVTGVLRLVQAGHAIDQTRYFRHDLFVALPWAGTPKARGLFEQTVVPFEVVIGGTSLGTHNLRVDDAAYREAGQGNHTSVLHWDGLGPTLAASDYTDHYVVLERRADGTYRLELTPNDPGAAAFIA